MAEGRTFLFLQGPHGPFFRDLAAALGAAGARSLRVGFNPADRAEWGAARYRPYAGTPADWPGRLADLLAREAVTDLVLYGDARPLHRAAAALAAARGLPVHCFEEGYLRPWWITYERGGTNGHSRLMQLGLPQMRRALAGLPEDLPEAPAHWGATRAHAWHGLRYHARLLAGASAYPHFRTGRSPGLAAEFLLQARRVALAPLVAGLSRVRHRRLRRSGAPYHLVLLQLGHDSSMLHHSPFRSVGAFMAHVAAAFAEGAPPHHRLAFKTHPFDDGRERPAPLARALARRFGLEGRIVLLGGSRLAPLLDGARSVVTVNSTGGQQALWRGLPLSLHGRAVYDRPEFVSRQPLPAFFRDPAPPDLAAYRDFRRFLLATSQVRGGFYTAEGRAEALRRLVDLMLDPADPYDRLLARPVPAPPLRLVGARG